RNPARPRPHPLSLHDALPISAQVARIAAEDARRHHRTAGRPRAAAGGAPSGAQDLARIPAEDGPMNGSVNGLTTRILMMRQAMTDRKSARLNSSHVEISYAVF